MKYVCIILSVLAFFRCSSQDIQIHWIVNHTDLYLSKKSVFNKSDSSVYTVGLYSFAMQSQNHQINSQFQKTAFISKVSKTGEIVWLKNIGSVSNMSSLVSRTTIASNQNGNLIFGISFDTKFYFGDDSLVVSNDSYNQGVGLFQLDSAGAINWFKLLNVDNLGKNGIIIDNSNNIIVCGTKNEDFFISKYSATGDLLWTRFGGSTSGYDAGSEVIIDAENNIYAMGTIQPNNGIYFDSEHPTFGTVSNDGSFLAKYDENGIIQWVRCFYSTNFTEMAAANSIELLTQDRIVVGGSFNGTKVNFYPNTAPLSGNFSTNNTSFLLCYDSAGNLLWKKKPHNNYTGSDGVRHINRMTDSDFVLSSSYSNSIILLQDTLSSAIDGGQLIEKYDVNGNLLWYYPFMINGASYVFDMFYENSDYYLSGSTTGNSLVFNNTPYSLDYTSNIFIAKLHDNFVSLEENEQQIYSLFPNPTSGNVKVHSKSSLKGQEVMVYNTMGELVYLQLLNNQFSNELILPEACGMYFINVGGQTMKVVKE